MEMIQFDSFLEACYAKPLRVLDASIDLDAYVSIDISSNNLALAQLDVSSSKVWETYIKAYLLEKRAKVAFGGYLEKRDIYGRSAYFKESDPTKERNIHLGIDLWCEAETQVLSVLDGTIHSFQNNTNYGDYGPTIIIMHSIEGQEFYSLYGHLSLETLAPLKIGQKVNRGAVIGKLGKATINGDYAPHLHFQLIKDLQGKMGDYPGVSSEEKLPYYKNNCPDPNLLLKLKAYPN